MRKFIIKTNKNYGICDIIDSETKERTLPLKRALNMFQGQDIRLARKECVQYTKACLEGNEKAISEFHYKWNPCYKGGEIYEIS